ncbi:BofC C-terminal domain-containing protein [Bacillus sp. RG28]|uniref:BofC C-terminal domain-containing protein n=1 Tax=Gottfriedia endophytica TaxID=2820819 RepID=A0A940NE74_9BACI|nr:BofC C-terminal domain-containing protein [Gottfriedia endophytica]MBP0723864.1 BofC C-terminal domain-containing protein [Gottfriedia endophytica]
MYIRIASILSVLLVLFFANDGKVFSTTKHTKNNEQYSVSTIQKLTVILHRVYVNGEVLEEIYLNQHKTNADVKKQFSDWQVVEENKNEIVLLKKFDDLSPSLKSHGYIGISNDGMLNLYIGFPKSNNIIDSFFQIDTTKLEVYRQNQLKRGIRVKTKKHYEKILHDLKQYALKN